MAKQLRKCAECVETYHRCVDSWQDMCGDEYTPESIEKVKQILRHQDVERLKEALRPQRKKLHKLLFVFFEILKYPIVLKEDQEINLLLAQVKMIRRENVRT